MCFYSVNGNLSDIDLHKIGRWLVPILEIRDKIPRQICTGSILNYKWILTASRCITNNSAWANESRDLQFYISNPKLLDGEIIPVEQIYISENNTKYHSRSSRESLKDPNQLALMKLITPINVTNFQIFESDKMYLKINENAVKLPKKQLNKIFFRNMTCFVASWLNYEYGINITLDMKVWVTDFELLDNSTLEIDKNLNENETDHLGSAFICNDVQYAIKTTWNNKWRRLHESDADWITSIISITTKKYLVPILKFKKWNETTPPESRSGKSLTNTSWFKAFVIALMVGFGIIIILIPIIIFCECKMNARERRRMTEEANLNQQPSSYAAVHAPTPTYEIKPTVGPNKGARTNAHAARSSIPPTVIAMRSDTQDNKKKVKVDSLSTTSTFSTILPFRRQPAMLGQQRMETVSPKVSNKSVKPTTSQ